MSLSSSNHGRQQSPSRSMRKTPARVLNQKYWTMPVSVGIGGLALTAYTGSRHLDLEQDRHNMAGAALEAPGSKRSESDRRRLHGRKSLPAYEVRA